MVEYQCRPHGGDYSMRGLSVPMRIWEEIDPQTQQLVAIRPGYLRWNGVPYSEDTVVREYYDVTNMPNGDIWLIATTIVEDPLYLDIPYVTSTNFKKQADDSGWNSTPCTTG